MVFPARLGLVVISALACQWSADAQLIVSARAGLIDYAQGTVLLDSERLHAGSTLHQMQPGQRLRTAQGRAEVLLAPGIMMRLGDEASVRIDDTSLEDTQVSLEKGSAYVEVVEFPKNTHLRVLLGDTEVQFRRNGLYRFDASSAQLRVYGGEAGVLRGTSLIAVKRGQAADLSTIDLSEFKPGPVDQLHTWAAQRSFTLFNTSSANRRKQTHWKYVGDGWLWNRNYGIQYRSVQARRDNSWAEEQLHGSTAVPRADAK